LGHARVALLPIRLPLSPYLQIAALVGLAAIAISTLLVDGLQYSVPSFIPFLLIVTVFYWTLKRRNRSKLEDNPKRAVFLSQIK
jgi:L-asparagine transporter-like permease